MRKMTPRACEWCGDGYQPRRSAQRFCGRSCSTKSYAPVPIPIEERFWKYVETSGGPEACWIWVGAKDPNGYGRVSFNQQGRPAHRVAWYLTHGSFPKKFALHSCDNPPCVNPAHLRDGDQFDNMSQSAASGRHGTATHPDSFRFIISPEDSSEIFRRSLAGETAISISRDFGVTAQSVGYHIKKERLRCTSR